jgi:hypothetical protein
MAVRYRIGSLVLLLFSGLASALVVGQEAGGPRQSGYSGMARLGDGSFVVTHDFKAGQAGPRLGVIAVSETSPPSYSPVAWDGDALPSDLEAICPLPGLANEFLALESGHKPGGGRAFHLALSREAGAWKMSLRGTHALPPYVADVEGAACAAAKDGRLVLVLAERGGTKKNPNGRLRWGALRLGGGAGLDWPESNKLDLKPFPDPGKGKLRWRGCTDLYLDDKGQLWAARGVDPGDAGPFRSAIYRVGRLAADEPERPVVLEESPKVEFFLDGFKVEGLAGPALKGSAFSVATDDENFGGTWRPVGVGLKKGKK